MHQATHIIPIVAGFEIVPSTDYQPTLDRAATEAMAKALADDLAGQLPEDIDSLLVVGGLVVEPNQLLRPGFLVWQALDQLAKPIVRDQGLHSGILAIGSHNGQMPDDRLQPSQYTIMGQFVCVPMLLVVDRDQGPELEARLEADLFETGSINPPARALLAEHARLDSVHGQLLTRNDLLALQRVQLDSAGLSGFWDVIEAVLIAPDQDHHLQLPANLKVQWHAKTQQADLEFLTLSQWIAAHPNAASDPLEEYGQWLRAYRTTQAFLDGHGIVWQASIGPSATWDEQRACVLESSPLPSIGSSDADASGFATLTEHIDPNLGLVAWTLIDDDRMIHLYPIKAQAIEAIKRDFSTRGITDILRAKGLCYNDSTKQLTALPTS